MLAPLLPRMSRAQGPAWPTKPVRLVVPFPPGASNDIFARTIAAEVSPRLGQQMVVENRAGAGGIIGSGVVAQAPADGYTLLLISSAFAMNATLHQLTYDPVKSFTPVAMLGKGPGLLAAHPKLGVTTFPGLLARAKAEPGKINVGTSGVGSYQHLALELLRLKTGLNLRMIHYRGGGPALADLVAGQVEVGLGSMLQVLPQVREGKLVALGVSSRERFAMLPDVPTIAEHGAHDYEAENWWGVVAPAGTPEAIIERMHREITGILGAAELAKRFATEGAAVMPMSRDAFTRFLASELDKWARVVKDADVKAE